MLINNPFRRFQIENLSKSKFGNGTNQPFKGKEIIILPND